MPYPMGHRLPINPAASIGGAPAPVQLQHAAMSRPLWRGLQAGGVSATGLRYGFLAPAGSVLNQQQVLQPLSNAVLGMCRPKGVVAVEPSGMLNSAGYVQLPSMLPCQPLFRMDPAKGSLAATPSPSVVDTHKSASSSADEDL